MPCGLQSHAAEGRAVVGTGACWADNPLADCDRVLISLYTTDTVEEMLDQLADGLRPGQILIDTTTGAPEQTARLGARLAARGVQYLDAPISGSSEQTRRGEVTTIVGGDRATFEACRDLFDCFSQQTIYAGPCGSGARMKLVSNLVLGLNRAALAEGLVFAQVARPGRGGSAAGLDQQHGLFADYGYQGPQDDRRRFPHASEALAASERHLPDPRGRGRSRTAAAADARRIDRLLEAAEAAGFGDADNSAIIRALRQFVTQCTVGIPLRSRRSRRSVDAAHEYPDHVDRSGTAKPRLGCSVLLRWCDRDTCATNVTLTRCPQVARTSALP